MSAARLEGYRTACRAAGLRDDPMLIASGDFSFESGRVAAEALLALPHPPSAVVASSDQMALAAVQVAKARGLVVPDDLSVVSFDDSPLARFSTPPLTAIVQPIAAMTARAAELLIVGAPGDPEADARSVLPFTLAVRDSTAAPPP